MFHQTKSSVASSPVLNPDQGVQCEKSFRFSS